MPVSDYYFYIIFWGGLISLGLCIKCITTRENQQINQTNIEIITHRYEVEYNVVELPENDDRDCMICLDNLNNIENDRIIQFRCKHLYHKDCIKGWIESDNELHFNCPLCLEKLV